MELAGAGVLASSLGAKITSALTMAQVGGAATGAFLAGLSSQGFTLVSQAALCPAASSLGSAVSALGLSTTLPESAAVALGASVGAKVAVAVAGGGLAVVGAPMVLSAMGFTGAGITASSLAAKMMSVTAIANGGGVPAGSLVATLQSVGATGLSLFSKASLGTIASVGTALVTTAVSL
ncbi:interferon alpha-inducible protein 27, mitochondrial-like [Heterocephalus glaber]|uniref:Interferon alpha-inducible protein 27, mitochondrial-like n=1 Tax=Heterocephalus glaber TaxID=10181 RepID=A0AAX6QJM7_HETGA|nr:interferon alpha-inducible protein 27, mitochondrial-like [Heterocephalus glaber]XP_012921242.1 interferon alpha-inducible protein 27, mitochondrial-like [Heterocephalus glaber]XP_012921246.1 interferon alpha-inducible protein 27, mitochondrial-like [Heterocephalus glaber]XP_012921256.1 interferon alpha-inducible protein 27, mitochondrial-like [Heterocephalus glaber]